MAMRSMRVRAAASADQPPGSAGTPLRCISNPAGMTSAPPSTTGVAETTWRMASSSFSRDSRRAVRSSMVRRTFSSVRRTSLPAARSSCSLMLRSDQKLISLTSRSWTAFRVLSTDFSRRERTPSKCSGTRWLPAWARAACSKSLAIHGAASTSWISAMSPAASGSKSRWGAQPASMVWPEASISTNCMRREATRAGSAPSRTRWSMMNMTLGASPKSLGSTSTAPCLSWLRCCSSTMSVTDCIKGWPGCSRLAIGVPTGDVAVAVADDGGDVGDLVAARLARPQFAAQGREGLLEEGADEKGLELAGFGLFHFILDGEQAPFVHHFFAQGVALDDVFEVAGVERAFDLFEQALAHPGVGPVADGLDQQVLEALFLEHLAEDVEHAPAQRLPLHFELLEQALKHIALAGFGGDHVPQVADLGLADAVEAPKALPQRVGVPRQAVVDHQVGVLRVRAFARRVGGNEKARARVVAEQLLHLAPFLALDAAVDHHHGFLAADEAANLHREVVQRVAVFGEDDELALATGAVPSNLSMSSLTMRRIRSATSTLCAPSRNLP